jgi:ATP-dependent Clp protease ATP-binding subunit ClpX
MLGMEGVKLTFKQESIRALALEAQKLGTGARGLRSILEGKLLDAMYEIPSLPDVTELIVDKEAISGSKSPILVMRGQRRQDRRRRRLAAG